MLDFPDVFGKPAAVFVVDLLLAGDNAVVIALVCMSLPPRSLRWVLLFGTVGAVVLRVLLAGLAGTILALPGLKLAGGVLLALLAANLARPDMRRRPSASPTTDDATSARGGVFAAALVVIVVDVLMSLDNVIALAAISGDNLFLLAIGLLLSVSIVMFGSAVVGRLLARYPELARLGAALLGWVAASMAVSDALLGAWIDVQSPALAVVLPALSAAYVYLIGGGAPAVPVEARAAAMPVAHARTRRRPKQPRAARAPEVIAPPMPQAEPDLYVTEGPARSGRTEMIVFIGLFVVAGVLLSFLLMLDGHLEP